MKGRGGAPGMETGWPVLPALGRALSTPREASPVRLPPRPVGTPRPPPPPPPPLLPPPTPGSGPQGLRHPRVSDCPTGCADVAAPLIHSSCLGYGRKAASSPGNDCISKSPQTIPLKNGKGKATERRGPPKLYFGSSLCPSK